MYAFGIYTYIFRICGDLGTGLKFCCLSGDKQIIHSVYKLSNITFSVGPRSLAVFSGSGCVSLGLFVVNNPSVSIPGDEMLKRCGENKVRSKREGGRSESAIRQQ